MNFQIHNNFHINQNTGSPNLKFLKMNELQVRLRPSCCDPQFLLVLVGLSELSQVEGGDFFCLFDLLLISLDLHLQLVSQFGHESWFFLSSSCWNWSSLIRRSDFWNALYASPVLLWTLPSSISISRIRDSNFAIALRPPLAAASLASAKRASNSDS